MPKPFTSMDPTSSRPLGRQFLVFLLPLIFTNILQNLSMTINTIYVGQMLGVDAVAAVAVFMPVMFCLTSFVIGLAAGATVVVGQAYGAKDIDTLRRSVGTTLLVSLVLGVIIGAIGVLSADKILYALGTDEKIHALALPYFVTMLIGCPLIFSYLVFTSVLRGISDSVSPLLALFLTIAAGLLITPALIQGWFGLPKLGIMAPAVATLIGNAIAFLFLKYRLKKKQRLLQLDKALLSHLRIDFAMLKLVLKLGVPTGVQLITTALAGLVIIGLINRFGANATAAYGAIAQIVNYIQFPAISIAIAASIFAAQAIGANQVDQLRRITRTAQMFNLLITGGLITLGYLGSRYLMLLFITDPDVVIVAQALLHTSLWSILFFGTGAVFASIMRASGTVWIPMLINLSTLLVVELPLAYWLSNKIGLGGIWYAYAATFVCGGLLQWSYYHFVWKKQTIQKLI